MSLWNRAEQVIIAQYLKSDSFLSHFLVIKHVKRTNISPEINRSAPKSVFEHVILPRKGSKSCRILKIVQFWLILLNSDGSFGHFSEI